MTNKKQTFTFNDNTYILLYIKKQFNICKRIKEYNFDNYKEVELENSKYSIFRRQKYKKNKGQLLYRDFDLEVYDAVGNIDIDNEKEILEFIKEYWDEINLNYK